MIRKIIILSIMIITCAKIFSLEKIMFFDFLETNTESVKSCDIRNIFIEELKKNYNLEITIHSYVEKEKEMLNLALDSGFNKLIGGKISYFDNNYYCELICYSTIKREVIIRKNIMSKTTNELINKLKETAKDFFIYKKEEKIKEGIKKGFLQQFSGGLSINPNFTFIERIFKKNTYSWESETVIIPSLFLELTLKFDYLFLKNINSKYKIGFGLSLGDSINLGGIGLPHLIFIATYYTFFNRIGQKITLVNMIGSDETARHAIFETGLTLSLTNFFGLSRDGEVYYYVTSFIAPYLFIGFRGLLNHDKNIYNIIGGFVECNFDLLKNDKNIYSAMKEVNCYLSFGIEYRIGYCLEK